MSAWIIKSETCDPDRAIEIVENQREMGYNAWIEDENGAAVDEQLLKTNGRVATKDTLAERFMGPLVVIASVVAGLVVLYFAGSWIEP